MYLHEPLCFNWLLSGPSCFCYHPRFADKAGTFLEVIFSPLCRSSGMDGNELCQVLRVKGIVRIPGSCVCPDKPLGGPVSWVAPSAKQG